MRLIRSARGMWVLVRRVIFEATGKRQMLPGEVMDVMDVMDWMDWMDWMDGAEERGQR